MCVKKKKRICVTTFKKDKGNVDFHRLFSAPIALEFFSKLIGWKDTGDIPYQ